MVMVILVVVVTARKNCHHSKCLRLRIYFSASTPFLQRIQKKLSTKLLHMPEMYSVTALLDAWVSVGAWYYNCFADQQMGQLIT